MSDKKPRNVPNADDKDKDELDNPNLMGQPERTVKQPGKPTKRVLNELDPEDQGGIDKPIKLQECGTRYFDRMLSKALL